MHCILIRFCVHWLHQEKQIASVTGCVAEVFINIYQVGACTSLTNFYQHPFFAHAIDRSRGACSQWTTAASNGLLGILSLSLRGSSIFMFIRTLEGKGIHARCFLFFLCLFCCCQVHWMNKKGFTQTAMVKMIAGTMRGFFSGFFGHKGATISATIGLPTNDSFHTWHPCAS